MLGEELLGHYDAMDLDTRSELANGAEALDDACLDVAEAAIDWRQFGAQVEDCDVDGFAAGQAESFFGGVDQDAGQAFALMRGVYGELAQVAALSVELDRHTANNLPGSVSGCFFSDQYEAFPHCCGEALLVCAGSFEESFDCKGGVDELDEAWTVGVSSVAEVPRRAGDRKGLRFLSHLLDQFTGDRFKMLEGGRLNALDSGSRPSDE